MLRKQLCTLVLMYLSEVDTARCCQGLVVSLRTVVLIICPLTAPLSLLATEMFEREGTSC